MSKQLKAFFKYLILLLIGLSILYFLYKKQYNPNFFVDLQNANWFWAVLSGFLVLVSHFFRSLRWQLMITPLQNKKPKILNTFNALMVGYLANLIVPRAGEVVRCAVLAKKEKLNSVSLLGTVIAERMVDLIMLFILLLLSFLVYADLFLKILSKLSVSNIFQNQNLIIISLLIIVLIVIFILIRNHNKRIAIISKVKYLLQMLKKGALSIREIKEPLLFFIYTLIIWLFYILSSLIGFRVLQETSILGFFDAILTVVAGSFGMIAPIQGGIGAYHFMVTEVLSLLNISKTSGLEYATIIHAAQTLIVIVFGLIALILGFNLRNTADE